MKQYRQAKWGKAPIARPISAGLTLALLFCGGVARAQDSQTLLIQPALPDDFDRGRNISVLQRERPDYDPLGIPVGSFIALPQINLGVGYSDNLYYSDGGKTGDGYVDITPSFLVKSNWSRHEVRLRGDATLERYFTQGARNQTPYDFGALANLELGSSLVVTPEAQISHQFETPFSGETAASTSVLSSYERKYASLRTEYTAGQTKLTAAIDDTNYQFDNVEFRDGTFRDQSDRDRNIVRATGQAQFAFTPSVAVYGQFGYARTIYDRDLLTGQPSRNSNGYRMIAGFNFDLSGLLRGTLGAGYVKRDFLSSFYRNIGGFSAEAKIEYFPSELTTFTLMARRVIEDSTLSNNSGFFDTRASLRVDHELLRNLLLHLTGEYAHQDYVDTDAQGDTYRFSGGAVFLSSNWLSFNLDMSYTGRSTSGSSLIGQGFNEFRSQIGVTLKR